MKYIKFVVLVLAGLLSSAIATADGSKVALGGYCAVGYVAAQKIIYGDPKYGSEYEGKLYYLSSEAAKKMFDAEPTKFVNAIKYDSYCATGVAMGKKLTTDPNLVSYVGDKVYLFSSQGAKDLFDKDPKAMIAKAEKNWQTLN